MGDAERLNGKLEPEAKGVIESISGAALVSLAVSVKRIADQAGAAASEARIKALEEALSDLLSLCENAAAGAFRNGVTDTSNTIDEGEVIAWRFMDNARALLKEADQ